MYELKRKREREREKEEREKERERERERERHKGDFAGVAIFIPIRDFLLLLFRLFALSCYVRGFCG